MKDAQPERLIFLTNRVGRQLARLSLPAMEYDGFTPLSTHVGLLKDLITRDGQRQQDLAITGIKDKATVARSISQLLKAGFIARRPDDVDRRQKIITLTDKGRDYWAFIQQTMAEVMPLATENVDPKELAICMDVLHKMYNTLHEKTFSQEAV